MGWEGWSLRGGCCGQLPPDCLSCLNSAWSRDLVQSREILSFLELHSPAWSLPSHVASRAAGEMAGPCAGCCSPLEPDDTQWLLRMVPSCPGRAPAIQLCCLHDTALISCPCLVAGESHRSPAGTEQVSSLSCLASTPRPRPAAPCPAPQRADSGQGDMTGEAGRAGTAQGAQHPEGRTRRAQPAAGRGDDVPKHRVLAGSRDFFFQMPQLFGLWRFFEKLLYHTGFWER